MELCNFLCGYRPALQFLKVTAWIVFAQKGNAKAKAGDKKIDREIRLNLIYFFIIDSFLIWQVQHI